MGGSAGTGPREDFHAAEAPEDKLQRDGRFVLPSWSDPEAGGLVEIDELQASLVD